MGQKVSHPNPPEENEAKATADQVFGLLQESANNFFLSVRLGEPSGNTLGYPLTDMRLFAQEHHIVVQTDSNVTPENIRKAINDIFSGNWKGVVEDVVPTVLTFLSDGAPKPHETAVNDDFSTSFLKFENCNVVQYSIYVKRTNARSMGTLSENEVSTLLTVICKGIVDYGKIDPQAVLEAMLASGIQENQIDQAVSDLKDRIKHLTEVNQTKREIESGLVQPEENGDRAK